MAIDSSNNFIPQKAPVKPTVAKPHSSGPKPAAQDPNKPTNHELAKQDANAQQKALNIVSDAFSQAGNHRLAVQTSTTATVAAQVGTGQLQQEEERKLSKTDTRKVPPKAGFTNASQVIENNLLTSLDLAAKVGLDILGGALDKAFKQSPDWQLSIKDKLTLERAQASSREAHRAGINNVLAENIALTANKLFYGKGMDSELNLVVQIIYDNMSGTKA